MQGLPNGKRGGGRRRVNIPVSLASGGGKPVAISNPGKITALHETEREWAPLLTSALIARVPEQVTILRALHRISAESGADIFSILVQRWAQKADPVLAGQAYAKFVLQFAKGPKPGKPARKPEKTVQASAPEPELPQAYAWLNRLHIPAERYSQIRGRLIKAARDGNARRFLEMMERKYGKKREKPPQ